MYIHVQTQTLLHTHTLLNNGKRRGFFLIFIYQPLVYRLVGVLRRLDTKHT